MLRSLRFRLVLISTLVSGAAIAGLGFVSWHLMMRAVRESTDVRLEGIAGRLIRDVNPWADQTSLGELFAGNHSEELATGLLALKAAELRDEFVTLGASGWTDGFDAALPGTFPVPDPNPMRRPEPRRGGPGGPGRDPHRGPPDRPEGPGGPPEPGAPPEGPDGPGGPGRPGGEFGGPFDGPPGRHEDGRRLVEYQDAVIAGNPWRIVAVQERGFAVFAGIDFHRANPGLAQLRHGLLLGTPLALCLVALGGWLVAERAMRPLRHLSAAAERISVEALGERMPEDPHSDPEIARLTAVLNAMMDRLEIAFAHANRFSADVSHELKTPVAVMQGEIETALRECTPGSPEESALLVLRGELSRLKSIIGSLLMLSRADVGNLIQRRETFSLSSELEALAEDAEILCEGAGVRFESEIEPDLTFEGDPVLLRQALLNLLNNGVKFNTGGGYVRITAARGGEGLVIAVENSGPGIAEEDRARVFDRFFRGDRARSREVDGFGLGLSLAKVIIEGHGGRLLLEETSPELTRFAVRLP
jgi:signal transduction histidine kinase